MCQNFFAPRNVFVGVAQIGRQVLRALHAVQLAVQVVGQLRERGDVGARLLNAGGVCPGEARRLLLLHGHL